MGIREEMQHGFEEVKRLIADHAKSEEKNITDLFELHRELTHIYSQHDKESAIRSQATQNLAMSAHQKVDTHLTEHVDSKKEIRKNLWALWLAALVGLGGTLWAMVSHALGLDVKPH